ncbi:hypothetical protein DL546_002095 [Coniochaeta pulveracea]|uniref:NADH:flavin oxidoreductase/NADH oxidase N-terminal domain-containing protein n=1 Tax=Coniochaeta pulveracea TaxID=177199 RepID=A0A420YK36_9PEZI|nr:hypothetical protein DL546_002095 [Coniochaeta pulveracea]
MEHIAQPLTLPCGLTLPNRMVKAAMAENLADANMLPTPPLYQAYAGWAEGGWGMVLTGNVQVDARYLGAPRDLSLNKASVSDAQLLASWKEWAKSFAGHNAPTVMQINHPGRQSPAGAGTKGFFEKNLAPSAVPLKLGDGWIQAVMSRLVFGVPKEMTVEEIQTVVRQFADCAKLAAEAGFHGVQIHGAHGYLLAQFLSASSNLRTDAYGGSPRNRARIVVEIIKACREATPKGFCVGIKLNSVDHQSASAMKDCIEQLEEIRAAGVDFLEVSGGSYEDPSMFLGTEDSEKVKPTSVRTQAREAFFLEFTRAIRDKFTDVPLCVTGGFRTRQGMEAALAEGACEMVGVGRPAVLNPSLPKSVILNKAVKDEDAKLYARKIAAPWWLQKMGGKAVGAGAESSWYSKQIGDIRPETAQ